MLLLLDEEHREHLSYLTSVPIEVVKEFCRIALEFLRKEASPKIYQSAAQKLGVAPNTVQHAVEGLMYLFTEASKLILSEIDFYDSVMTLGLSEDVCEEMKLQYMSGRGEVRNLLSSLALDQPSYNNLHWRLDVKLASRTLRYQIEPTILLQLQTKEGSEVTNQVLQTDPVNLIHLTKTLESALDELKSPHCRRILRNI